MGLLLVLTKGEGATCFSREKEFRWGNLRGKLLYEFVVLDWAQCLEQGAGSLPAMLRGCMPGLP